MRVIKLLFLFIFGLLSCLVLLASTVYAGGLEDRLISDSLVKNLSCRKLSVDSIYAAIRKDAFDQSRNLPIKNWYYDDIGTLGVCWSLSRTQRMISYMARYNVPSIKPIQGRVPLILDMIRGSSLVQKRQEQALSKYQVFEVEEPSFQNKAIHFNLWDGIFFGYLQYFGSKSEFLSRKFQYEIEAYQSKRFFDFENIGMIWSGGARSKEENIETLKTLIKNLDGKRLTLLALRLSRTEQHVVMAKSYFRYSDGLYEINVYDSNFPGLDTVVYFSSQTGEFVAPVVVARMVADMPDRPLGVFIVDEDDRKDYEIAMLEYYRSLCR